MLAIPNVPVVQDDVCTLPSQPVPFVYTPPAAATGDTTMDVAARALCGSSTSVTSSWLTAMGAGRPEFFLWHGGFCDQHGPAKGKFWIPAYFRCTDLLVIVRDVLARKNKDARSKGMPAWTYSRAAEPVRNWHTGLRRDRVAAVVAFKVEIDHLPRAEQQARYKALADATGLRWGLICFTGGKSEHAYLFSTRIVDPKDAIVEEIQMLLIAILEGDTKIKDAGRLMRLPGWDGRNGDGRVQPVVHLDADARYEPEFIRDRLRAYAEALGIHDVDAAVEALRLAEQLQARAKHDGGDAAFELLEHAATLRATRAAPAKADLELATAMLDRHGGVTTPPQPGTAGTGRKAGTIVYYPDQVMAHYATMPYRSRTEAPCCADDHTSGAGEIWHGFGQPPRVHCYRCDHTAVVEPGEDIALNVHDLLKDLVGEQAESDDDRLRAYQELEALGRMRDEALEALQRLTGPEPREFDPDFVLAAEAAVELAKRWRPAIRKHWRTNGIATWAGCGFSHGLGNVQTGNMAIVGRGCGKVNCEQCGPRLVSVKIAAIAHMPLSVDDTIVGQSLDRRTVYVADVPAKSFQSWVQAFRRAVAAKSEQVEIQLNQRVAGKVNDLGPIVLDHRTQLVQNSPNQSESLDQAISEKTARFLLSDADAYAAFWHGSKVRVVSTLNVKRNRNPNTVSGVTGRQEIRDLIFKAAIDAHEFRSTLPIGNDTKATVVLAKITTSQNLPVNPDEVLRLAKGSPYRVEEEATVSAEKAAPILTAHGITCRLRQSRHRGHPAPSVETEPVYDMAKRAGVWAALRVEAPAWLRRQQAPVAAVDFEDLLHLL